VSLLLPLLIGWASSTVLSADSPAVARVEPPGWWAGHTHNPVRLLISGEGFAGARVEVPSGFVASNLRVSENGHYLFVDLRIPPAARPGSLALRVVNQSGAARVPFELLSPVAREGRFQGFTTDDVIYLLMPDRFANGDPSNDDPNISPGLTDRSRPRDYHGGDLQGVIDRLDYLQDLGVTTLWLTPWYDNANHANHFEKYGRDNKLSSKGTPSTDYHGYGAVDFYGVEEHFGDLDLVREFVSQAQARGMKVVQDQVANHTGPSHPWVADPPTATWYNGTPSNHLANSWKIWTTTTPNPPPDQLQSTLQGWFIDILPDLNQNDPEVATYLIENSLWWLGVTGADAVRQDTLPYVPRRYWAQWSAAVKREYPRLTVLGETLDGDPKVVAFFQGKRARFDGIDSGVDTLFDFPLYYAIREVFAKQQPMTRLTDILAADTNYVDPSVLVTFLGLHDKPRFMHEPGATAEDLMLAFTFILTTRGTPMIYYGDEIAMNGSGDPDNRRDFPGGWPGDGQNAFDPSDRTPRQQTVHEHVSRLLALRRQLDPLRHGTLVNLAVATNTYAYARTTPGSVVVVALNSSPRPQRVECSLEGLTAQPGSVLGSVVVANSRMEFVLPGKTAALFAPEAALTEARKDDNRSSERPPFRQSEAKP